MNIIQAFLKEGYKQTNTAETHDDRFGCSKIKNPHRKRLCRISSKIKILRNRYEQAKTLRKRQIILSQLKKWRNHYRQELYKNKITSSPENA